jgi:ATP-dependent RNA helicase DeaD
MLSMGFKEELDAILENITSEKQTLLFSATMPNEIMQIAEKYMKAPVEISVGKKNTGAENVEHHYYIVHAKDRFEALKRIADINPNIYGIIFCRTRMSTKEVAEKLMHDGYNADALHGDLSQAQRDFVMDRFRRRHLHMLVATDVAARGLDVNNLTHVIHFDLPDDPEIYIHRSGRTGRAGKTGISVSIIHMKEKGRLKQVEKKVGKQFIQKQIPTGKEVCEKQLFNLIDKVENVDVDDAQIGPFMPVIYRKLEWLEREELINHFVSVEFNRFLLYYANTPDLNIEPEVPENVRSKEKYGRRSKERGWVKESGGEKEMSDMSSHSDRERGSRKRKDIPYSRFFINLGRNDEITKRTIIDLINQFVPVRGVEIGKIEVQRNFSFFEIDLKYQQEVLNGFKNVSFDGAPVTVDLARQRE